MKAASQCVIDVNGKLYCVFNKKYNKYAPIGGKCDSDESPQTALVREIKEELGDNIICKNITRLGVHNHDTKGSRGVVKVYLYKVSVDKKITSTEDFLEVIAVDDIPVELNEENAYTSLVAIIKRISKAG